MPKDVDIHTLGCGYNPEYIRREADEGDKEKDGLVTSLVLGSAKWSYQIWFLRNSDKNKRDTNAALPIKTLQS